MPEVMVLHCLDATIPRMPRACPALSLADKAFGLPPPPAAACRGEQKVLGQPQPLGPLAARLLLCGSRSAGRACMDGWVCACAHCVHAFKAVTRGAQRGATACMGMRKSNGRHSAGSSPFAFEFRARVLIHIRTFHPAAQIHSHAHIQARATREREL